MWLVLRNDDRQRLFFALWPALSLQSEIDALNRQLGGIVGGHRVAHQSLHLTLSYLGAVDQTIRDCLERGVSRVMVPPFTLHLDVTGYWPKPRVFWLAPQTTPNALSLLVVTLQTVLQGCGLEPEQRPFQPHVTLRRKADIPVSGWDRATSINWRVDDFALVESNTGDGGVEYRVLRRWPLSGGSVHES